MCVSVGESLCVCVSCVCLIYVCGCVYPWVCVSCLCVCLIYVCGCVYPCVCLIYVCGCVYDSVFVYVFWTFDVLCTEMNK